MKLSFNVLSDIDSADVMHPEIPVLQKQWRALPRTSALPRLSSFDWRSLECAADLLLVERLSAERYYYQAYGANIASAAGFDLTGRTTDELKSRAGRFFVECYERALSEARPLYTTHPALHVALVSSWERLLLPLADDNDEPRYVLCFNRPASFRHELLEGVMNATPGAIIGLAADVDDAAERARYTIITLNQRAEQIIGPRAVVIGRPLDDVIRFGDDALAGEGYVTAALERPMEPVNWRRKCLDGDEWYRIEVRPFEQGGVMTMTEITDLKRTEDTLSELAMTDSLTGVSNRRRFMQTAGAELKRSFRNGTTAALILLDIDHFKAINDEHGHPVGDQILVALARRVARELREPDQFARLGGEEFGVLLPETNLEQALGIAARIRAALINEPFAVDGRDIKVTCSFGLTDSSDGAEFDVMYHRADESLYEAKNSGRDAVRAHDPLPNWQEGADVTLN